MLTSLFEILAGFSAVAALVTVTGLCAVWALLRGWSDEKTAWFSAFSAVLVSVSFLLVGNHWSFPEVWRSSEQALMATLDSQTAELTRGGMTPAKLEVYRDLYRQYVVLAFPAWVAFSGFLLGLVMSALAASFLTRITRRVQGRRPFREWRFPEPLIFGFLLACLLKLFRTDGMPELHPQNLAADNLLIFFIGLYTVGGLSIISHYFHRWRFPWAMRLFGYVLLFNLASLAAATFGILDVWFDFRRVKRPAAPREVTP